MGNSHLLLLLERPQIKSSCHLSMRSHLLLVVKALFPKKGKCRSPPLLLTAPRSEPAGARNMFDHLELTAHNRCTGKGENRIHYTQLSVAGLQPGISTADDCETFSTPCTNFPSTARSIGNARKLSKRLEMTARP